MRISNFFNFINEDLDFKIHYLHNLPQFSLTEGYSKNYGGKKCYYLVK